MTRPKVIEDMLLFAQGDTFDARLIDESARALRAGGFIADAVIEPVNYDPATNSVDVNVKLRDSWSLALEAKLNRKGGQTEWGIGLSDNNLLGTGKTLQVGYVSEIDRDQALLGYSDPNVLGSRVRLRALFSNASDGHRRELNVERPFFSLYTRWSAAASCTTRNASTRSTISAKRSTSFTTRSTRRVFRAAGRRAPSTTARSAGYSVTQKRSTGSCRRSTSRTLCCCRRTASSPIRGSGGSGSSTITAR